MTWTLGLRITGSNGSKSKRAHSVPNPPTQSRKQGQSKGEAVDTGPAWSTPALRIILHPRIVPHASPLTTPRSTFPPPSAPTGMSVWTDPICCVQLVNGLQDTRKPRSMGNRFTDGRIRRSGPPSPRASGRSGEVALRSRDISGRDAARTADFMKT
jgi:hypothetical protein